MKIKTKAKGFSLLEVLVAIVLIALGFLSMLALQMHAMQFSTTAYYRGMATQIGNGLASSIRSNPEGLSAYTYKVPYNPAATVGPSGCQGSTPCGTPGEVAEADIKWARQSAKSLLPGGDLYVSNTSGYVDVVLIWQDPDTKNNVNLPCGSTPIGSHANVQCMGMRIKI